MSYELINRISIKKDGVYVSTHSNNDTAPYHSVKINRLSEAYLKGGQRQLDKEIIDMCFNYCDLRGNHKSVLPYIKAIEIAISNSDFNNIRKKHRELEDKAFYIANRMGEYRELSKEESEIKYLSMKPKLEKLKNERNDFVVELVEKERCRMNSPKELNEGIYEVILPHLVEEAIGEVYNEYMNINSNNGTIIYEKRMGHLLPNPEILKISEYQKLINKHGIENVGGATAFKKFIHKYPQIYMVAIENEERLNEKNEEEQENQV